MLQIVLLSALAVAGAGAPSRSKLVVMDLAPAGGVTPAVAAAMTEAVTAELSRRNTFEVLSSQDVRTLLGLERQRQLLGCSEGSTCLTEIAGALGAHFVLSGSLAQLGDLFQLNLQTIDATKATPIGRATRMAADVSTLRRQLTYAIAEATGLPLPEPPSKVLPVSLMAVGGGLLVAGGLVGLQALNDERVLARDLQLGTHREGILRDARFYEGEADRLFLQKTGALVGAVAGAALIGVGVLVYPRDPSQATVAIAFSGQGVALAGRWP